MTIRRSVKDTHTAQKLVALRRSALFSSLSDAQLIEVATVAHERALKRNEILFLEGSSAEHLFVVVSGSIRAYRINKRGREQIVHVERAGAILAEVPVFDDGPYPATAAAEEPSKVLAIEKNDFKAVCLREPAVPLAALKIMAGRLRRHAELVNSLSLQEVSSRLALLLLDEAKTNGNRIGPAIRFEVKLSNQQLAARIGSVREVVSRTLNRFVAEGMVLIEKRSHRGMGYCLLLTNESALQKCADLM